MPYSANHSWLTRFALATAVTTLVLIGLGGLVTSHGAGLSVPDWPTSYGYNMFFFPISKWVGGILYEHTHRLVATFLGVLVVALTRWLGGYSSRKPLAIIGALEMAAGFAIGHFFPNLSATGYFLSGIGSVVLLAGIIWFRSESPSRLLRQLGWFAFWGVQLQGLLGGLRVVWLKDQIGIFHAALAQVFFVLLCAITLLCSRWWRNMLVMRKPVTDRAGLRSLLLMTTALIFGQLVLGATMRHQHAGLAIPDFPLAYHKVWPPLDADSIASYNAHRLDTTNENPITAFQIVLQMVHRFIALTILCLVLFSARTARRDLGADHLLAKLSLAWVGLILAQIVLGAVTIWSNKAADIATAHVVTGALALANGTLLTIISFRVLIPACAAAPAASEPGSPSYSPGKPAASSAK